MKIKTPPVLQEPSGGRVKRNVNKIK